MQIIYMSLCIGIGINIGITVVEDQIGLGGIYVIQSFFNPN